MAMPSRLVGAAAWRGRGTPLGDRRLAATRDHCQHVSNWFRSYGFADVFDELLIGAYPLDSTTSRCSRCTASAGSSTWSRTANTAAASATRCERALAASRIEESRLRLVDYGGLPPEALEQAVQEVNGWLDDGKRSYVHCRAGWQRSAAVAAGVVALREGIEIDEALARVQSRKPSADPLPHQRDDLRRWWASSAQPAT